MVICKHVIKPRAELSVVNGVGNAFDRSVVLIKNMRDQVLIRIILGYVTHNTSSNALLTVLKNIIAII